MWETACTFSSALELNRRAHVSHSKGFGAVADRLYRKHSPKKTRGVDVLRGKDGKRSPLPTGMYQKRRYATDGGGRACVDEKWKNWQHEIDWFDAKTMQLKYLVMGIRIAVRSITVTRLTRLTFFPADSRCPLSSVLRKSSKLSNDSSGITGPWTKKNRWSLCQRASSPNTDIADDRRHHVRANSVRGSNDTTPS